MKIAINEILGVSICSYRGPLKIIAEDLDYQAMEDLRQETKSEYIYADKGKIGTYIKINDLQPKRDRKKGYLEDQAEELSSGRGEELKKTLAKYGVFVKGFSIYKPRYYNFEQDTLDIEIETTLGNWRDQYPELIEHVQYYIDNIRKKSCDGYQSYEPSNIDEVDKTDYAYIWAILCKEHKFDEFEQDLQWNIEDVCINGRNYIDKMQYEILRNDKRETYEYNRDRACLEFVEEK